MDVNYTIKTPKKYQQTARNRQWIKTSSSSKVIFRRELLESADNIAIQTARAVVPISKQDGTLFDGGTSFTEMGLHAQICDILANKLQIRNPTFIQQQAIPPILASKDVIIKAQTGSGKTLAFLLPILTKLIEEYERCDQNSFQREAWSSKVLIISPTKELALQSEKVARILLSKTMLVTGSLTGAVSRDKEKASLRKGITVISGTPGRVLDHLNQTSCFKLTNIVTLVLDECDQLISHGFLQTLQQILSLARNANQSLQVVLASATADQRVVDFIKGHAREALPIGNLFTHECGVNQPTEQRTELVKSVIPASLDQKFCIVPTKMRMALLISALAFETAKTTTTGSKRPQRILVFAETRDVCSFLNELLMRFSDAEDTDDNLIMTKVFHIHGSMNTEDRQIVWHQFLDVGGVLVATDVAARGLNLGPNDLAAGSHGVDLVIQFEAPSSCEQYVHRVGRAGRMGQHGRSILFLLENEAELIPLLSGYGVVLTATPVDTLAERVLDFRKPIRLMEKVQTRVEELVMEDKELRRMAVQAFCMYIRGYSMKASSMRHIFHVRSLHLGHVAKGFGLAEPPSKLLKESRIERMAKRHANRTKEQKTQNRQKPKTKFDASERDNRRVFVA